MTMPHERLRALEQTAKFLRELAVPSGFYKKNITPIRKMALTLLKHYPMDWELEQMAQQCPKLLAKDQ